jgi:membrane protease YdiL (CAAX protease family)
MLIPIKKYRKPICLAASLIVILLFASITTNKLSALRIEAYIGFFTVNAIFLAGYLVSGDLNWSGTRQVRTAILFVSGLAIGWLLHAISLVPNLGLVSIASSHLLGIHWVWLVAFALGPALFEEALLRGYLNDFLNYIKLPLLIILFVQGALFAAAHFVPNNIPRTGFFCLLAVLLTLGRMYFDNLVWPIGVHFAWNFFSAVIYGVPIPATHSPGFVPLAAFGPLNYYLLIFCCITISIYFLYELRKQKRVFRKMV